MPESQAEDRAQAGNKPETAAGGENTGALTDAERRAALERELQESMAEFDGKLLSEQQTLEQEQREQQAGGGESANSTLADYETEADAETAASPTGSSAGRRGASGQASATNIPANIPSGDDDDIVARQLREAAENETDPELRERLWEEYREYKASTAGQST